MFIKDFWGKTGSFRKQRTGHNKNNNHVDQDILYEAFEKPSLFVISTEGRNLNRLELLRFFFVDTPRNDKSLYVQLFTKPSV